MQLVTKTFANQCLAFPDRVDQMLAKVETLDDAKEVLDQAVTLQKYAQQLKSGVELEKPIAHGVLKCKAKIGELMPATPRNQTGRGKKVLGPAKDFSTDTIAAYRKLAKYADKLDDYVDNCEDVPTQSEFIQVCTKPHVTNNSAETEWYTPSHIVELAREVLGGIDCDPASSEVAQKTIKAKVWYSKSQNGLTKQWKGRVWLNPPYSSGLVDGFVTRLCQQHQENVTTNAILLTNNATDTKWFQLAWGFATAVCFPSGRISFCDANGDPKNKPLQGQVLLCLGPRHVKFCKAFSSLGSVTEID